MKSLMHVLQILIALAVAALAQPSWAKCIATKSGESEEWRSVVSNPASCYRYGKLHGQWEHHFADGAILSGTYVDGKQHGKWELRMADGSVRTVRYMYGDKWGDWEEVGSTRNPDSAANDTEFGKFVLGPACDYFGLDGSMPHSVHTFHSSSDAEQAIRNITNAVSLEPNFRVLAAGVPNAAAVVKGDLRYILYSRTFMNDMKRTTNNDWAALSIMAHEIGHHLQGHTLQAGGSRPSIELEADKFSGGVLQKLGASLEDAQIAMRVLGSEHGSRTHPAKRDRLEAIAAGWEASCERDANCKPGTVTPTTPGPVARTDPQDENLYENWVFCHALNGSYDAATHLYYSEIFGGERDEKNSYESGFDHYLSNDHDVTYTKFSSCRFFDTKREAQREFRNQWRQNSVLSKKQTPWTPDY